MKKTWVLVGDKLVPKEEVRSRRIGLQVIPDIAESFISPVDGSVISSRSNLREHNHQERRCRRGQRPGVQESQAAIVAPRERQADAGSAHAGGAGLAQTGSTYACATGSAVE